MNDSIDLSSIEFRVGNSDGTNTPEIYCPDKSGNWKWRSMAGTVFPKSYSKYAPSIPGIDELVDAYPVFGLWKLYDKLIGSGIFPKKYLYTSFDTLYSNVFEYTSKTDASVIVNCVRSWFAESLYELKKFHGQESNPMVTGFDTAPLSSVDRGEGYFIDFTNIKVELHSGGPGLYYVNIQLIKNGVFGDSKKFFNFFSWILPENFGDEINVKQLRGYIKDYGLFTIKSLEEELSYVGLRLDYFYSGSGEKKLQLFRLRSVPYGNKVKRAVKDWIEKQYSKLNKIDKSFDMFTTESKRAKKYNNKNNGEAMREIKITSGKLRSMIKEYVSDQKINKLKGVSESQKPSRNNIADYNQHRIAVDTVKNPNKSMFGGPNVKESEDILRNKFGYTDQEINKLKGVSESSRISESPMSDVEKIKGIVQNHVDSGGSLIGLGTELKKAGYKSQFSTEPLAMHMIKIDGDTFVITNKKYISDEEKPDFVVGELAGGFM